MHIDNNSTYIIIYMHCNENESEKKWNDQVKHVHTTFVFHIRSYMYNLICTVLHAAICPHAVDMNIATRTDCLTPLLVTAKYSVKNSVVWMLGSKDTANIHTSAVTAAGQNALHLVVQNQQCEYSLEVSTLNHFLLQKHIQCTCTVYM